MQIQPFSAPRFKGQEQVDAYKKIFEKLPQNTVERLWIVQRMRSNPVHTQQAKAFGKVDKAIDWVNREIKRLVEDRDNGPTQEIQDAAKEALVDMRTAVSQVFKALKLDTKVEQRLQKLVDAITQTNTTVEDLLPPKSVHSLNKAWHHFFDGKFDPFDGKFAPKETKGDP